MDVYVDEATLATSREPSITERSRVAWTARLIRGSEADQRAAVMAGPGRMLRRRTLVRGGPAALGTWLVGAGACAHRDVKSNESGGGTWRPLIVELEARVPRFMAESRVPGASIAVIHDGVLVWRRGFGYRDGASKAPVDAATCFEAASMSKPVFAYVALKLCERGVIGLDTPLARYTRQPFHIGDPRLDLVTARHVLSHSSGFQNWRSREEPLRIHFVPGSQYKYSGEGYFYLQSVITHLLGRVNRDDCARFEADLEVCATDIEDLLSKHALVPFGMSSSGYAANRMAERNRATGHDSNGTPLPRRESTGPAIARYAAVGGLVTTPTDYARFVIEIIKPKAPDSFRLREAAIREMLRPHVKVVSGPSTSSWALGWQVQDSGLINHGGDNDGFHCHAVASPATRSGLVVMTNAEGGPNVIRNVFSLRTIEPLLGTSSTEGLGRA
jgi:CubicO group peptidase (beta-lactamase class C family)